MRRMLTVLAGAVLVVGLAGPVWAEGKTHSGDQPITAMDRNGHGGGHGGGHDGGHGGGH